MILDLINAICTQLIGKFPTYPMYIENIPEGFDRPSFFIKYITGSDDDLNKAVTNTDLAIQLVCFGERDKSGNIPIEPQYKALEDINKLFEKKYVQVEDRAIKIISNNNSFQNGDLYITFGFNTTSLKDYSDEENFPTANTVEANINI